MIFLQNESCDLNFNLKMWFRNVEVWDILANSNDVEFNDQKRDFTDQATPFGEVLRIDINDECESL